MYNTFCGSLILIERNKLQKASWDDGIVWRVYQVIASQFCLFGGKIISDFDVSFPRIVDSLSQKIKHATTI